MIGRNLIRGEVRVVVDDGQRLGEAVKEVAGDLAVEQELVVEESALEGRGPGGHARTPSSRSTVS